MLLIEGRIFLYRISDFQSKQKGLVSTVREICEVIGKLLKDT